ncbi:MAG: hypothetical protein N2C14_15210, partial [Planctomycetales bacterium]
MAKYSWPKQGEASLIGSEVTRLDGGSKVTGAAKYSYDVVRPNMAFAKALGCPHANAKVKKIDTTQAKKVPGVVKVEAVVAVDDVISYAGALIAVVVADSEGAAAEGTAAVKVDYEVMEHYVD